jgi:hypothetical protein
MPTIFIRLFVIDRVNDSELQGRYWKFVSTDSHCFLMFRVALFGPFREILDLHMKLSMNDKFLISRWL